MTKMLKVLIYLTIAIVVIIIVVTGNHSTPYAACRDFALYQQGWGIWVYQNMADENAITTLFFLDGVNTLSCQVIQIGPLWYVNRQASFQTLLGPGGCSSEKDCPWKLDYYGVSP